jgi:siroheme synthase (precorrin-2 oxidase/ferrochelatase)
LSKGELNTKMYLEFIVSEENNVKHKCFAALRDMSKFNYSIDKPRKTYTMFPISQIESYT